DDVDGNEVEQLPREIDVMQRHPGHAELLAQDLCDLCLRNETDLDEQAPQAPTVLALLGEGFLELRATDEPSSHQELAEPDPRGLHVEAITVLPRPAPHQIPLFFPNIRVRPVGRKPLGASRARPCLRVGLADAGAPDCVLIRTSWTRFR